MAIYTKTDLVGRVLALLGETGFDPNDPTKPQSGGTITRPALVARILARLGEAGFDLASLTTPQVGATAPRSALLDRVLARLGEAGFDLSAPSDPLPSATVPRADLLSRILARLDEAGFVSTDPPPPDAVSTTARSDLVLRILARLGEVGFVSAVGPDAGATFTRQDLVRRVLVRFGEVGFAQTAEPEAEERVRVSLPTILADLYADRVYPVNTGTNVPPEAMDALSALIASRLSDDFAIDQNGIVLLANRAQGAEAKLKRLRFDFRPRVEAALGGILSELATDRVYVAPSDGSIDTNALDALSAVAAARLIDDFQVAADRAQIMAGEAEAAKTILRRQRFGFVRRADAGASSVLAELTADRVYTAPSDGSVHLYAADAVSAIVASRLVDDFRIAETRTQIILSEAQAATSKLRRLRFGFARRASDGTSEVLAELDADRIYTAPDPVTINLSAIDAVSAVVTSRLADDFQIAPDRSQLLISEAQAAIGKLKRLRFDFRGRASDVTANVLYELDADHVYAQRDDGLIDAAAADALSSVVTSRLVDDFQIPSDRVQVVMAEAQAGTAKLKRLRFGFVRRVSDAMPGILDELEQDRIYDFGLDDQIPGAAFDPLAVIVASRLSTDFGLDPNAVSLLAGRAQGAEARLRRYRAQPYIRQPARPDYF